MIRLRTGNKVRKANRHFFEESGIRSNRGTKQHPFVVLRPTKTSIKVDLVYDAEELLELPTNTRIMAQWKGKRRSDFYTFKVSELKKHIADNPPQARQKV
jgi:hypothetical protein